MCTVSWLPQDDGYFLCFNRDERRTRAPGRPPVEDQADGVRYLAPRDGDFGGTWLAVNEFGLTLCLLNLYRVPGYTPPPTPRSRGLLVLDLARGPTGHAAMSALGSHSLARVQPFSLVAVEPGGPALVAQWDGTTLTGLTHDRPGLILTSSSVTEPEVGAARRALFAESPGVTADRLRELHRSHLPERGRRSVCMHREDAETQSSSEVTVDEATVSLRHIPDAPCRGTALPSQALTRRHLPSASTR
jgi:hypothetical protein